MRFEWEVKAKLAKCCPFCGSAKIKALGRQYYEEEMNGSMRIECEDCGTMLWYHDHDEHDQSYNGIMAKAIKKWNRRAAS